MRAKIMLLSGSKEDEIQSFFAEQVLIDISAAFGHSFSLYQEKIGKKSLDAHGEALTDAAVAACQQCQAVFLCDGGAEGAQELYDALDLPLRVRSFSVPEALCGRHEAPVSLLVGDVLSLDEETLRRALRLSCALAKEEDIRLCAVSPAGAFRAEWDAAVRAQSAIEAQLSISALDAPQAVSAMVLSPERMGLMLCPPYAGSILLAAGTALCTHPGVIHDYALDEGMGVYSAYLPQGVQEPQPFSAALAVSKLLRYSLRLQKEAACVEAAVKNVMSVSFHARQENEGSLPELNLLELICEQITVAGELMHRGGLA